MECEYCKKEFQTKSSLNIHKKNAKYCLQLRGEIKSDFKCLFCEKIYSNKYNLDRHLSNCKIKMKKEMKQKEDELNLEIEKLKQEKVDRLEKDLDEFKKIALKKNHKTIINDNSRIDQKILNMSSMCDLKNGTVDYTFGEHYNKNYLMKGINGLVNFCIEHLLKTPDNKLRMICTDPSRNIFTYKDDKGNIYKDVGAEHFINMISDPAKRRSERVFNEMEFEYNQMKEEAEEEEEEEEVDHVLLNIEKQRVEHAYDKKCEIQNLEEHKSKFVKKLVPPLYNGIKGNVESKEK